MPHRTAQPGAPRRPIAPPPSPAGALLAGLLALTLTAGCGRTDPTAGVPRVVLVTFDTLHVGYTGAYNPEVDYTPHLDRLATEGVVFDRAYTTVPITLPAHASMMTGRHPSDLGVMANGDLLGDDAVTLPELLRAAGYRTGAFVSLGVLGPPSNLTQGFETYDGATWTDRWYRTADEVVAAAGDWVAERGEEPFFLWVHLSDPHEPYLARDAPPDARLELDGRTLGDWTLGHKEKNRLTLELPPGRHRLTWRSLRAPHPDDTEDTAVQLQWIDAAGLEPYLAGGAIETADPLPLASPYHLDLDNTWPETARVHLAFSGRLHKMPQAQVLEQYRREVAFADHHFGALRDLFRERGLADGTLWAIASDHGEGLFHHRSKGHAAHALEDQLRILWLLAGPGLPRGRRVADLPVLNEDLAPTLLELLGLPPLEGVTGSSRVACWSAVGCAPRAEWWAYGAVGGRDRVTAVAGYRWPYKVLWQRRSWSGIFDLASDPWEERRLAPATGAPATALPRPAGELAGSLERRRRALQARFEERNVRPVDREMLDMLEALGYLGN